MRAIPHIDADRSDLDQQPERERIRLLFIDDARRGLADIEAGRTHGADEAVFRIQQRRASANTGKAAGKLD